MKRLKTSDITSTIGFPPKKGTFDFIQDSYKECISSVIISMILEKFGTYYPGTVYILNGLNLSTGVNYTIDAGAVFYQGSEPFGEVYQYDGGTFPVSGGVPVANFLQTQYSTGTEADPVTFTDLVARNVHDIRKITFVSGASGSGSFTGATSTQNDLSNMINLYTLLNQVVTGNIAISTGAGNGTITGTIYYQKDIKNNTLLVEAVLTASTPSDFDDYPGITFTNVGTIPVGFRPASTASFDSFLQSPSFVIYNAANTVYLERFEVQILSTGVVRIRLIKPDAGVASYIIEFKTLISLY